MRWSASCVVFVLAFGCGASQAPNPTPIPSKPADPPPAADLPPSKECDDVLAAYKKVFDCGFFKNTPPEVQDAHRQNFETIKSQHFQTDTERQAASAACKDTLDALQQWAKPYGCEV